MRDKGMILQPVQISIQICGQVGLSSGFDRILVYRFFNTMAKNLQTARSVLIIGFLQSILSTQTLEFVAMLDQQVQTKTTYLNEKYE